MRRKPHITFWHGEWEAHLRGGWIRRPKLIVRNQYFNFVVGFLRQEERNRR